MADIIQLLPDHVANQIAAGEVIQRPASVVKELLENAIDAGAEKVRVIIKDSGRTLVQVIDDGCGMSTNDARMAFESHATSKITDSQDLFQLRTKGFRGEALASIASVAHVELKTRQKGDDVGTLVHIEDSDIKKCEATQCAEGSSFAVKNLFYNTPARRQFLKSDKVEMRHIMDEFQRVALAHPKVAMSLHHNGNEVYHLNAGALRQRVVGLFGQRYDERLMPVEETTDVVAIKGFCGKPEFSRKTRGEQFFFVNDRFIKHSYFHHAVTAAMEGLLPNGHHPMYVIFLDVDPQLIDVNVHPNKTEVKFREERAIYTMLRSTIRKALGQFQISPTLDFDQESSLNIGPIDKDRPIVMPKIDVDPTYNPFEQERKSSRGLAGRTISGQKPRSGSWEEVYKVLEQKEAAQTEIEHEPEDEKQSGPLDGRTPVFQLGRAFVVSPIKSGMMVIDQQRAHERILYERFAARETSGSQQLLYPQHLQLSKGDYALLSEATESLQEMGFDIDEFGGHDVIVRGLPADAGEQDPRKLIDAILEELRESGEARSQKLDRVALGLARGAAIRKGQVLRAPEMRKLIDELFACEVPNYNPTGQPAIVTFTPDDFASKFE
jgi:DNA mismatch repair protein MutL